MQEIHEAVLMAVAVNVEDLEDREVAVLYMALSLGQSLEGKLGAEKLEPLYTEGDYQMTEDVKNAFMAIAGQRLQEIRKNK